jgi:predicted small integral membrane protein
MMRRLLVVLALPLLPLSAAAQQTQGWGQLNQPAETGFDWTAPAFKDTALGWMAWTPATLAFFGAILTLILLMCLLEWRHPGGAPRDGVLGLTTTRGDRLFITLLGSAYVFIGWLLVMGTPVWGALALAFVWAGFVVWKV